MNLQSAALAIALLLGPAAALHASPAAHFASSHSFRGGFSSSRSAASVARPPSQARGGFGSFGSASRPASASGADAKAPPSALSGSLAQQAAKDNALRTLDQRRAAAQPAPLPPAGAARDVPAGIAQGAPSAPSQPAPVIVQQRSGVGDVVTGYVLGRMASHGYAYGAPATVPFPAQERRPKDSPGASFLHTFLWLLALSALGWGVYFVVRRMRQARQASRPNYTFERD